MSDMAILPDLSNFVAKTSTKNNKLRITKLRPFKSKARGKYRKSWQIEQGSRLKHRHTSKNYPNILDLKMNLNV